MRFEPRLLLRALAPTPVRAARLFVAANIAFLGVDIALAHLANDFAHRAEWAPVVFSAAATLLLLPGALGAAWPVLRAAERVVAMGAVFVGVTGIVLHLDSAFFARQTLHHLVYSAPFAAPLSYVGVGALSLLVHSDDATTPRFGGWLLLLALGGFAGNFALSVLDHAQNGFFYASEWIPVVSSAYAVGFLAIATIEAPTIPQSFVRACAVVLILEALVGIAGAALHLDANLRHSPGATLRERFVFGAPAFAPLLFPNLALLAGLGLWACQGGDIMRRGAKSAARGP